jgi:hypothetical protein
VQTSVQKPSSCPVARLFATLRVSCIAGLVAAMTSDLWLYCTSVAPVHGSMSATYVFIAHVVFGGSPIIGNPVVVGMLAHLAVSIGWAYGYTDLASRNQALSRAPWISGSVFGILVLLGMQSILLSVHQFHAFSPLGFVNVIVLHTLFFGIPIALLVARLQARPA